MNDEENKIASQYTTDGRNKITNENLLKVNTNNLPKPKNLIETNDKSKSPIEIDDKPKKSN